MRFAPSITSFRGPITCSITVIVQHNQFHSRLYRKLERWWVSHSGILEHLTLGRSEFFHMTLDRYLRLLSCIKYVGFTSIVYHKRVIIVLRVQHELQEKSYEAYLL